MATPPHWPSKTLLFWRASESWPALGGTRVKAVSVQPLSSIRGRVMSGKSAALILPPLVAIFSTCVLTGCLGQSGESSSPPSTSSASSTTRDANGASPLVRKLPWVGEVVITHTSEQGIVIRDRATGGSRFFISAEQAGECLNFLDANPNPTRHSMAAACPGYTP